MRRCDPRILSRMSPFLAGASLKPLRLNRRAASTTTEYSENEGGEVILLSVYSQRAFLDLDRTSLYS